jgi:hypothetical protein
VRRPIQPFRLPRIDLHTALSKSTGLVLMSDCADDLIASMESWASKRAPSGYKFDAEASVPQDLADLPDQARERVRPSQAAIGLLSQVLPSCDLSLHARSVDNAMHVQHAASCLPLLHLCVFAATRPAHSNASVAAAARRSRALIADTSAAYHTTQACACRCLGWSTSLAPARSIRSKGAWSACACSSSRRSIPSSTPAPAAPPTARGCAASTATTRLQRRSRLRGRCSGSGSRWRSSRSQARRPGARSRAARCAVRTAACSARC